MFFLQFFFHIILVKEFYVVFTVTTYHVTDNQRCRQLGAIPVYLTKCSKCTFLLLLDNILPHTKYQKISSLKRILTNKFTFRFVFLLCFIQALNNSLDDWDLSSIWRMQEYSINFYFNLELVYLVYRSIAFKALVKYFCKIQFFVFNLQQRSVHKWSVYETTPVLLPFLIWFHFYLII